MLDVESSYELPSEERQEALLDALGRLVELRGYEPLVTAPTLEPTNEFFPDEWTPTVGGVRTLIRRLMAYASLEEQRVDLEVFESEPEPSDADEAFATHRGVAAWYAGQHEGSTLFGLDVHRTRDPVELTAVLCHEVAHAYRDTHGIMAMNRDVEEELTDLTTIYLGFGVLTVSAAYESKSTGSVEGGWVRHEYTVSRLGYLSPAEMAFLLAARAAVRGDGRSQAKRLAGMLPANQAQAFREAHALLSEDVPRLRERLGVPPPMRWPERPSLDALLDELSLDPVVGDDAPLAPEASKPQHDRSRPTFRVRETRALRGAMFGSWAALLALLFAPGQGAVVLLFGVVGAGVGAWIGRGVLHFKCADPECRHALGRQTKTCPGCQRRVRGEISDASERLSAEEDLDER